ncbi:MAG: NADH-quinone oxidoreductase subunit K [Firmicutes bacterium]|nr:NADH-quinone oxidoreductase subunit K [Bacillota bacterium]
MSDLNPFVETSVLVVGLMLIVAGCYCLIRTYHLLKIIIGIEVAMKAVSMFIILAGFINGQNALAQTFVITVIVIEVVLAVVAVGIAINLYRNYGDMDIRNLRKLKG